MLGKCCSADFNLALAELDAEDRIAGRFSVVARGADSRPTDAFS